MPRDDYQTALSELVIQYQQIFARNLQEARKARGWTQQEAAERCMLSRGAYRAAEEGRLGTAVGVYWSILDAFGLAEGISELAAPHKDEVGRRSKRISSRL